MELEFMLLWYFKLQIHKTTLSFHPDQFFLLVSMNDTTMFPLIQVENSDSLQFNKHFMGAYYLPGFDMDTETTFNSSHFLTAHFQWF